MRAVIQRVSRAEVRVDGATIGRIKGGLLVFLGIRCGDTEKQAAALADKCVGLRIFSDISGKFNLSALETGAAILAISQFTVYADTRKGRRPSFIEAAPPETSRPLYDKFVEFLRGYGLQVECGSFGAHMEVESVNDGPVTVIAEKNGNE